MKTKTILAALLIMMSLSSLGFGQMVAEWTIASEDLQMGAFKLVTTDPAGNTYAGFSKLDTMSISIMKFGPQGQPVWSKRFGLRGYIQYTRPYYMFFRNGFLWVIGEETDLQSQLSQNAFIRKIDTNGVEVFSYHYPDLQTGTMLDYAHKPNGEMVTLIDQHGGNSPLGLHLLCFAPGDSSLLWNQPLPISGAFSWWSDLSTDDNGNIYVSTYDNIPNSNEYVNRMLKYSPLGVLLWTWESPDSSIGMFSSSDHLGNSYALSYDYHHQRPNQLCRIDPNGNMLWQIAPNLTKVDNIQIVDDGGLIVAGSMVHPTMVKFDSSGAEIWRTTVTTPFPGGSFCMTHRLNASNGSTLYGYDSGPAGQSLPRYYLHLIQLDSNGNLIARITMGDTIGLHREAGIECDFHADGSVAAVWQKYTHVYPYTIHTIIERYCTQGCEANYAGLVYADIDQNCVRGLNEPKIPYVVMDLDSGSRVWTTNPQGQFAGIAPPGVHLIQQRSNPGTGLVCPNNGYPFTIDSLNPNAHGLYFGAVFDPNMRDVSIDGAYTTPVRPGFEQGQIITCTNLGFQMERGWVSYALDSPFTYVSALPTPDSIVGQVLKWRMDSLPPFAQEALFIRTSCSAQIPLGTPTTNLLRFISDSLETILTNNLDTVSGMIQGSYDPNHKSVEPSGIGPTGNILEQDTLLTYTIQFENVGNDTAFTVVVRDTISPYLDLGTLKVVNASHPWEMRWYDGRTIVWTFSDIRLPDSSTNPVAANGLIKYTIETYPNLPIGTVIENRADIFFDYNAPVSTNTVTNTVSLPVVGLGPMGTTSERFDFVCFPNPTNGKFTVRGFNLPRKGQLLIQTIQGKWMATLPLPVDGHDVEIDATHWPAGIYFVQIQGAHGGVVHKLIKQ